jgi:hypothetical protein
MPNKKILPCALAAALAAPAAHALTDAEIEARFQKYEAQIQALQAEIKDLKSNGGVVYVEDVEKQAQRNAKQIGDIKAKMDADAEKLKINGFMTAAVSHGDDPIEAAHDIMDNPNFRGDSRAGLQFNYRLGENASAVLQMVAKSHGNEAWETNAEWAYIDYGISEHTSTRMGRLRIPMYLFSETLDVGYTYPWVRPPLELYQTVLTSYEGADLLYRFNTGDINHTLQPFIGSSLNHNNVDQVYGTYRVFGGVPGAYPPVQGYLSMDFKDLYGVTLNSTIGDWTTKLTAMHLGLDGRINLLDGIPAVPGITPGFAAGDVVAEIGDNLQYYAVGGMYDNGSLFAMTEVAHIRAADETLLGDSVAGHATLGYRMGRWMPYGTYAWAQSVNDADPFVQALGALPNRNMKSVTVGVRRELTNQLSAKLEWNNYFDLENNGNLESGATSFAGSLGDDANVYTFALDAVF